MNISHKIKIQPTKKQETYFIKACGVHRFAYNWALNKIEENYKKGIKSTGYDLSKELNAIKKEQYPWMLEVSKWCCQQPTHDLYQAYKNWWKNSKHFKKPIFKKKGKCKDSFYLGQNHFNIKNKKLRVAKLGWVRTTKPLRFQGKLLSVTISRTADKWFASVNVETDFNNYPHACENQDVIGIDLGIKSLLTLSDGNKIEPIKALTINEKKLKKFHKELNRKKKGSKNKKKTALKLSKLYYKITNIRKNYLHLISSYLVKNYRYIGIEDLNVSGMVKNHKLAKSILDCSWYELKRQLQYKSSLSGSILIEMNRWFASSKICSKCGYKNEELKLSDRTWVCQKCRIKLDRDLNAAINIKKVAEGYSETLNACGDKKVTSYCEARTELN